MSISNCEGQDPLAFHKKMALPKAFAFRVSRPI